MKENIKSKYLDLLGITKKEVLLKIGDDFNFYPDPVWIYLLHRNILGKKTFLIITFDTDIVIKVSIKKTYRNL